MMSDTPRSRYPRERNPVPIVQEVEWTSGSVWMGPKNPSPIRVRTQDRPGRSQSLYRLRNPSHRYENNLLWWKIDGAERLCYRIIVINSNKHNSISWSYTSPTATKLPDRWLPPRLN